MIVESTYQYKWNRWRAKIGNYSDRTLHPVLICLQVNGEVCSGATLLFLDFDDFWEILLDMCIFSYFLHYYQKYFSKIAMLDL